MKLIIPFECREKLILELERARTREIGGILMGEHIGENLFRLKELTVQRRGGSFARFLRVVPNLIKPLRNFFRATNHDYVRFNYLGEWHSHPSFTPTPSSQDSRSMQEIVEDGETILYFAVLLIAKLNREGEIEATVTVYQPDARKYRGQIIWENKLKN